MRAENIGPHERRKRAVTGVLGPLVGLGAFVALLILGAPRIWRLGLFLPFWFGALGWFQAQSHT